MWKKPLQEKGIIPKMVTFGQIIRYIDNHDNIKVGTLKERTNTIPDYYITEEGDIILASKCIDHILL